MNGFKYGGSKNTGSVGWLLQRITAVLLVLLLLAHFIVIHYSGPGTVTFDIVKERLTHQVWGPVWRTITLLLLFTALFHGFNGVWGVLLDYIRKGSVRLWLFSLIVTIGLVLATLGSITILTFKPPSDGGQSLPRAGHPPAPLEVQQQGGGQ
ncbi:MAG: succinate dehydrogenase, hydrophobic membrane anchor protein [Verrucomicrobia bacterium]|nr:succinate dehydrogenase, hydrophobic membrane anchor protein [Verrucomicrobiota bacterium]